jgi:hypothetical protein
MNNRTDSDKGEKTKILLKGESRADIENEKALTDDQTAALA